MHLTLLVPGMLWPRQILRDTTFDLPLPALALLLGRGRRSPLASVETWLANTFGLPTPLPSAPLRLLGDGGAPEDDDWLCLDPVHLRVEERALVVADPAALALNAAEDAELRAAIAPLFDPVGEIVAPVPGRWHMRLRQTVGLHTMSLPDAIGHPCPHEMPGGPDGTRWRQLLTEAQTQLHAHPINRRREDAGQATVNSLWPWGPGRLPTPQRPTGIDIVWTNDPVLKGIGAAVGADVAVPPAAHGLARGNVLARLGSLVAPAASFDAMAWREALRLLEHDWLAPALADLSAGRCRSLRLIAAGYGRAMDITISRRELWRFWRKPLPLAELAV
jgi:hypothetical protein